MEIYNIDRHLACFCYKKGKDAPVEIWEVPCGTIQDKFCLSHHEIVFLAKGRIRYTVCGYSQAELTGGRFIFVPIGKTVTFETMADSMLFIIRQDNGLRLCQSFSIEQLYNKRGIKDTPGRIQPLEINPRLRQYLNGIWDTCSDGIMCRYFFEAKITELFVLLRAYYSDDELYGLFLPILSPDTEFSEFVRRNYHKYRTINDMASEMHLTARQFNRRFHKVFSCAPQEWILQEKAKNIHADICNSSRPLKQIADDYGFTVQAHLNRFCKKTFSMSPGEMRKKNEKQAKYGK